MSLSPIALSLSPTLFSFVCLYRVNDFYFLANFTQKKERENTRLASSGVHSPSCDCPMGKDVTGFCWASGFRARGLCFILEKSKIKWISLIKFQKNNTTIDELFKPKSFSIVHSTLT